nr:DDE-type integrase/transposase/recombinase [Novosphingobium taihuense]
MKLTGEMVYLLHAADQSGAMLEGYVPRARGITATLTFMRKVLKRHGSAERITTDGLRIVLPRTCSSTIALCRMRGIHLG